MPPCTSINHKNLSRNSGPFIFLEKYFPEAPSVSNLFILTFCGGKVGFNVTVCLCVHFLFLLTVATKVWLLAVNLPWVPEVFLACGGNFRCWPKADTSSALGRSREGHYEDLTETGNRARKVSGTQGTVNPARRHSRSQMSCRS